MTNRNRDISAYESDLYIRRLRKQQSPPAKDGAGLICGTRYNGKGTPLKGHGCPPPSGLEGHYRKVRKSVEDWSTTKSSLSLDSGMPTKLETAKPSIRLFEKRYQGDWQGIALLNEDEVLRRASRAKGKFSPSSQSEQPYGLFPLESAKTKVFLTDSYNLDVHNLGGASSSQSSSQQSTPRRPVSAPRTLNKFDAKLPLDPKKHRPDSILTKQTFFSCKQELSVNKFTNLRSVIEFG